MADVEVYGFSLTNRGPVDRALARVGLKSAEPPRLFVRAFVPALVIWLPLLLLELARPRADVAITFLEDLTTHVRFLLVVPLLVIAEASIGRRTRLVAAGFVDARLITAADRPRFDALLQRTGRGFESNLAEAVIAVIVVAFVWLAMRRLNADGFQSWFEEVTASGGTRLTAAGWWYAIGSCLPPFLFLRWVWRYLVWCWLLMRISRLDLQLVATHPDGASGLAFVGLGHTAFALLGFAASCLLAAAAGTRVLYEGAALASFKWPVAVLVAFVILIGIAPLAVFMQPLRLAKERGLLEYGNFSSHYVQAFHRAWIGSKAGERPLDARDDIGPLADIGASFERVYEARLLPLTLKNASTFAVAALLPMLPLLLIVVPLRELLKLLAQAMI